MSITETKLQLGESIELYEQLNSAIDGEIGLREFSQDQWRDHLQKLGLETAKLIRLTQQLDQHRIQVIKRKQKKLARHREWRKRHNERMRRQKQETLRKNEQWKKDIVWKVTSTPSVIAQNLSQQQQQQTKNLKSSNKEDAKGKIKHLSKVLSKLTKLLSLRRKRLEAQGHFFADEGSQFYNQVKEWHEREKAEQQHRQTHQTCVEDERERNTDVNVQEKTEKKLYIHPEDKWNSMPIDENAYKYWCEAEQSLSSLIVTRKMWDQYILSDIGEANVYEDRLRKVPPTFVNPSAPANWIWASYLQF
ncbi:hypothetical protein BDF20DRAFT_910748 [Mycotypha africana]|uniref:uncharacterized protein n=1 Tax=Mycotypha africana TaxID=64632 RepID=UPI0023015498|nr:uncharacterized protein BDF20DRAFT_910748 [Mycotypha africana]KAI8988226.1 hypothetical protein BDF20DRAFT_910748 [Mycotypha africana]